MTRPVTAPGRLIAGRYRLQSQIGGGGMGAVWLARDELLGREVAIKQVLSPLGADEKQVDEQRQRALREGRIAARLSHPHAISVYDVALENGAPWLVMEYLPSRSLAGVLAEDGVLRVDQVAQIGAQVADALAATHAAGIVHRDVKPANILIGQGGRVAGLVKITDFGISHAQGDVTLTQTGQITGTPAYLAPEVAQGQEMTEASDVFSLGATLYTCLEGGPPFGMDDNALGMLHRVAGGRVTPPRRAGSLTAPLMRMLAADPAERPAMTEVRDRLAKLAAGRNGDTTTVLLARTDLASSQGSSGTAVLPPVTAASSAPPVDQPTPIPASARTPVPATASAPAARQAVAAQPPTRTGPAAAPAASTPAAPPSRRRRWPWVAAALGVALLAGLLVLLLNLSPDDPDENSADPSPSSSEPAPTSSAEPEASEPAPDPGETEAPTSEIVDEPVPVDPVQATEQFFALIPDDLPAAHQLTSPAFQSEFPLARFSGFWDDYSSVSISDVQAEDPTTALVTITYVAAGGSTTTERHRVTFVRGEDGRLLMDRDVIA
ncbi:serine/threonine-protein kinase [Blastococcus atacamensis]|uniref:serine/threonine-protein kinase n=1 Tax=Blastococcus atacamensis TaxID=2070508 RepID=UPI001300052C|nr:serine/threonine-protein kinase [Blastococcus atacamensis]